MTNGTKDLWNDNEAAALKSHLALRVYTSRLLGQDAGLVMHGGGNTSVKETITNILGEKEDVIYIKGSGWDLATIEEGGFPAVRMDHVLKLRQLKELSDPQMMNELRTHMMDSKSPDPSVETLLHAFLPHRYVDHTHADAVLTLTNQPNGEKFIRELYGKRLGVVPYIMPGFQLAKLCAEVYESDPTVEGLILLKHGVFSFGATAKESYQKMIAIVRQAEEFIQGKRRPSAKVTVSAPKSGAEMWTAALRTEFLARGKRGVFRLNQSEAALRYVASSKLAEFSQRGPLTPDHVIRTKRQPLIVDTGRAPETAIKEALDKFDQEYRAYFARNAETAKEKKTMLDTLPRVVLLPGFGVATFGASPKEARIAMDIYEHTIDVISTAEEMNGFEALPESDIFDVEYWVLEQAKLKLGPKTLPLSGKVAVISGATTGIGLAIASGLLEEGASVVALDIDSAKFEAATKELNSKAKTGNSMKFVACDVSKREQVAQAIKTVITDLGGVDLVVPNAGIFPTSKPVESIDPAEWDRTLNVNLSGTFHLIAETLPWMKKQKAGGDIVVIASKNVPAPGKEAGAYSVSKAAQVQLARVTALEAGAHGVRVNMLHPHLVFDTQLWTEDLLQKRAAAYSMTVDQYKKNNLLKAEIGSRDVAKAVVSLARGDFSKTTGAQIPLDGGSDRTL